MRTVKMMQWWKISLACCCMLAVSSQILANENDDDKPATVDRQTEKRMSRIWKTQTPVEGFESIALFEAIKQGQVEVVLKAKDAANANLMVTNKSDKPLAIEMPPAFAAVPVMAQGIGGGGGGGFGGGGGGFGGGGQGGGGFGGGGGQGTGGGFGGGGGGGGFGGGGGGFGGGGGGFGGGGGGGVFNIPPGRMGKVSVKTFCLEHGKPDPRPRMDYTIAPIEVLSTDPKVHEMCRMLANDEITQPVAQAAAWNVANGLSWQELLVKNRIERMDGYYERYFSPQQLMMAQRVVQVAAQRADERARLLKESQQEKYTDSGDYSAGR